MIAATVAASACTLPGLGEHAPEDVVTPAAAQRVVQDYWRVNERGGVNQDIDTFALVDSDLLLEADRGQVQSALARGLPGFASPRPLRKVSVYVPHQRSYPAQFIALLETVRADKGGQLTNEPVGFYNHFVRVSRHAPWKADFYTVTDLSRPLRFALDSDGYATVLAPTANGYVVQPAQVGGALIDYFRQGLGTGTPSGAFAPGSMTTDFIRDELSYRDRLVSQGYSWQFDFTARPFLQAYRAANGAAVVFFALQATRLVKATEPLSNCIVQPPGRLERWGGLVPAGTYASVAVDGLLEIIAQDPPAKPDARVELLSWADDLVAARTVPSPVPGCR